MSALFCIHMMMLCVVVKIK